MIKCINSVFILGGDNDYLWTCFQGIHEFHSGHVRQFDIQKNKLRLQFFYLLNALLGCFCLVEYLKKPLTNNFALVVFIKPLNEIPVSEAKRLLWSIYLIERVTNRSTQPRHLTYTELIR